MLRRIASEMESDLKASEEYVSRTAQKSAIISGVEKWLSEYLSGDEKSRQASLAKLGLSPSQVIALDKGQVETILRYLRSQGLHFGDSAFLAIREVIGKREKWGENGVKSLHYTLRRYWKQSPGFYILHFEI